MALSTCGKCGGHSWEIKETEPRGSSVKWYFVQCSGCGVPVGVVDYYPNSTAIKRIEALEKELKSVHSDLGSIDHNLRVIAQKLR